MQLTALRAAADAERSAAFRIDVGLKYA